MKSISVLVISMMVVISCGSIDFQKNPPFKIANTSYHHWTGGQPGISGINILIKYQAESKVVFDSIFFQSKKGYIEYYTKDDQDYLIGRISTSKQVHTTLGDNKEKETKTKSSFQLNDDEAVLRYTYQDKTYYYKLSGLEKTDNMHFE